MTFSDSQTPQPGLEPGPASRLRVAAVGDLHVGESTSPYRDLFERVSEDADALCLCGDLVNFGKTAEVEALIADLRLCRIPMVGVMGNHEHECGQPDVVMDMLCDAGVHMLAGGRSHEIGGVGFAGTKGFVGGFGRYMLSAFGEASVKTFVQDSIDDATVLETSIRSLRTERSVVLLHYAPVVDTVMGEPPEIHAFLGSSRLAETIDRYDNVSLVVHGHAHRGAPEGRTNKGVPVYNVALPVLKTLGDTPYRVFEV
ncbi:metallophosphoesterase [uncultured Brevundimonas sp.]|uniref:metallophosphoesterase family protein n=1 Tax=uncultured Brevundimonas sp. TaxID=213418 RepID=UPI0025FD0B83|nr:metallophosphoesterase [uncultured Brevundimonas sp.]